MEISVLSVWEDGDLIGVRNSGGESLISENISDILGFIRYRGGGKLRVFWDLNESMSIILRRLPLEVISGIANMDRDVSYMGHHIYYLRRSALAQIGKTHVANLSQYWGEPDWKPESLEAAKVLADELLETLAHLGMVNPRRLTSPIACFEDTDLGKATYAEIIPSFQLPESIGECVDYAAEADKKDWTTAYQVGHFPSAFNWDINSAYGYQAAKLLDLRDMEFWKSDKFGKREEGAFYGFVRGDLYLDPSAEYAHASPIVRHVVNDLPGNPAGYLPEATYSLEEIRTVERYELGSFTMRDGWFIKPLNGVRPRFPFKDIMSTLYEKRAWSPLAKTVCKAVAVQLVGKLAETRVYDTRAGIVNDIYHALITAGTRCQVTKFLVENEVKADQLLAVQTDGCRILKDIPAPKSSPLGAWKRSDNAPVIIASPRKIHSLDRKPQSFTYDDIMQTVKKNPHADRYTKQVEHYVTLLQAVKAKDLSLVGTVEKDVKFDLFTLEHEQNRLFDELPTTGRELTTKQYKSKPVVFEPD